MHALVTLIGKDTQVSTSRNPLNASSGSNSLIQLALILCCFLSVIGCKSSGAQLDKSNSGSQVTDIAIESTEQQSGVKRLGINLSGQSYYDSAQISRNLIFRNPGFEAETWQSILRCKLTTATSCTDDSGNISWPANFLQGATFEFISGNDKGLAGTVQASQPSSGQSGVTFSFGTLGRVPASNEFVLVRRSIPGNPTAGWWLDQLQAGASLKQENSDLSRDTAGKQALRMAAAGPGQEASIHSYFDSLGKRSFVQLKGPYELSFRAKGLEGSKELSVSFTRTGTAAGNESFLKETVHLSSEWKNYSFDFSPKEDGTLIGTLDLNFRVAGSSVLLDDVSLIAGGSKKNPTGVTTANPTAFRDEVVSTLKTLHPGVLRYMDSGTNFGSSLDNMIASQFARVRAGFSTRNTVQEDLPVGLYDFLQLCQALGAEPWYTMQAGMSPAEVKNLIEYLAGDASTPYGAKRAAAGQKQPWAEVFPVIHLELGNEQWNGATFYGAAINDAVAYANRAEDIFSAARSSTSYSPKKFDLILGGQAVNTWSTQQEISHSSKNDSFAVAPYLFGTFNNAGSKETIFGSMFAEPEMLDSSPSGYMAQQAKAIKSANHPTALSVYEVNLGTQSGSVPQSGFDAAVPSLGAGLTVVEHMLLMMRDLGIKTQAVWSLTGYNNTLRNSVDGKQEVTPLFGVVIDMGGTTNLQRPQFVAETLANQTILPTMLKTTLTGANPTWKEVGSNNNGISIEKAHYLQVFTFVDGLQHSLIVFNLSRTESLPVTFSGGSAPSGTVQLGLLTSKEITDNNEEKNQVMTVERTLSGFNPRTPYLLPPFSMTTLKWTAAR
jgi:hypothetical protein